MEEAVRTSPEMPAGMPQSFEPQHEAVPMNDVIRALLDEKQLEEMERQDRAIERDTFRILNACPVYVRDLAEMRTIIAKGMLES